VALANYTDLKASIASWLPRADLTSTIPDCILMAEAEFNDRLRQNEQRANLTITGEYVTAPNDFQEFRSGYIDTAPRRPLHYLSSDTQSSNYDATSNSTSGPVYFSMSAGQFRFAPTPPVPVDAVILYYPGVPALSLSSTNWLLTKHPQLYLMASLYWGSILIKDAEGAAGYKQVYEDQLNIVMNAAKRARWGGPAMQARAA